ncbi:Putative acyl-CoA dehydrogenase AidB [Pigmentiphaga humi]|uniref:Acyl-CoA dehydrogenase AidB n=1 Tax=Pigmentiphaga humi TaxID=2478468 RepID=A0A3P4B245_9BURK|nr:isovaleryl-CoA dehydrogenase [Pigmentiphaga humi]VCU69770.1 Putative acyl-CoA dehydrogenase AidB [Pigmentiphaga humi]
MTDGDAGEPANVVDPLADYSLYDTDLALREAVEREGAGRAHGQLSAHGGWLGSREALDAGRDANLHPPCFVPIDPVGRRIDEVRFHPAWHVLMRAIVAQGLHDGPWSAPQPGALVARAAGYVMQGQVDAGTLCPTTMTFAAAAVLAAEPPGEIDFARDWRPVLCSRSYDPADAPIAAKRGALVGMGMTEKQGGSDVRANTTRADPCGAPGRGRGYLLTGHKWFYSVPQADAHLVLAQAAEGLSCFFVPRYGPDGRRNAVRILRLKDKLGNRSNASAEVEFHGAWGMMVGEPGRGVPTIIEMAACTRLDCVLGSAALLRQALVQALHFCTHRHAFGRPLVRQPLMRHVLADLALESEAATVLGLRLARAFAGQDPLERAIRRIVTPAAKYWVCKRAEAAIAECMEACGGNGYVEDGPMPRLYREAPVNAIWEGSGNVMCLDVLRAMRRDPQGFEALAEYLRERGGGSVEFRSAWQAWMELCAKPEDAEFKARRIAGLLTCLLQAALLRESPGGMAADAFIAARLAQPGWLYGDSGTGHGDAVCGLLLARAWPPAARQA